MIHWYEDAGKYGHRFYFPYLKIAKDAHNMAQFDKAQKYYTIAISCLLEAGGAAQNEDILAAAYTNLTSCLTMMHRYTEAEQTWQKAQQFPLQPGAAASAAILYAAMGQEDMAAQYIERLKRKAPMLVPPTEEMVRQILDGEHPHFYPVQIEPKRIEQFWNWFGKTEKELYSGLAQGSKDTVDDIVQKLKEIFPFLDRQPKLSAEKVGETMTVVLSDFYAEALHHGYGALIAACPKELFERWSFIVIH